MIRKHYFKAHFVLKQAKKKISIFYQSHGLTPLKIDHFFARCFQLTDNNRQTIDVDATFLSFDWDYFEIIRQKMLDLLYERCFVYMVE